MELALNSKNAVEVFLRLNDLLQVAGIDPPCLTVPVHLTEGGDLFIFDFLIRFVHYYVGPSLVVIAIKLLLKIVLQVHRENKYFIMIMPANDGASSLTTIYKSRSILMNGKWKGLIHWFAITTSVLHRSYGWYYGVLQLYFTTVIRGFDVIAVLCLLITGNCGA